MSQIEMFAQNIFLLIGLLFCGVVGLVLVVVVWIAIKLAWWRWQRVLVEREMRRTRYDENGDPLPPASHGACDICGNVFDVVYNLPDGSRLCWYCHREARRAGLISDAPAQAADPPAGAAPRPGDEGERMLAGWSAER